MGCAEKIVLVGAGSAMFTRGLVADLLASGMDAELALVDINPEALEIARRLAEKMIRARGAKMPVTASTDRTDVLPGATVVITTIAVGGRRAWEQDVFVPRGFDIFQPVGDSVGPGGTSRALRMAPAMVEIAEDIVELAPDALFFNYANPMAVVCRAIRKATKAKVVGLCHGVIQVEDYLASFLEVDRERLDCTAIGMNHLTWFTEVLLDGRDGMGLLRERLAHQRAQEAGAADPGARFLEQGDQAESEGDSPGIRWDDNPFSWGLFERFGAFPAVLDRHVCEFFPGLFASGDYYGKKLGVDAFSFENTIRYGDMIHDEMLEVSRSDRPLPDDFFQKLSGEHEQVIEIIAAIRAANGKRYSVNLPNEGRQKCFPPQAIIEAPAVATPLGLKPVAVRELSPGLAGALASRLQWVETTADAALERSREKFIQALMIDGYTRSLDQADRLADALLAAQVEHLRPFGWRL